MAKEHKLLMSAKQLRRGRLNCTLDRGTRRLLTGRHGLLWCGSQVAYLYPLLMQVLIIVSAASPQAEFMAGMFWARAGGMMNGSQIGTRPWLYLSMRIVCKCVHTHGMNE